MNERGHYGSSWIGQASCAARALLDPEYRRFEEARLRRDIGDKGISTQGKIILGAAAVLIVGIGIVGTKRGVKFID